MAERARLSGALRLRSYASLFNSYVGLLSALEDSRNLLMVGAGASGIAPLRAALEWVPVQARAGTCRASGPSMVFTCQQPVVRGHSGHT